MSKKVYVVIQGGGNGGYIVGVYDNPEQAEKVRASPPSYGDAYIEEREINTPWHEKVRDGLRVWEVPMGRDGKVESIIWPVGEWKDTPQVYIHGAGSGYMWAKVWARDEKHAAEVADGVRTRLITSGEWDRLATADGGVVSEEGDE